MKYIDSEKLIAEIERMRKFNNSMSNNAINSNMRNFYDGEEDCCKQLLDIINSLQQEQPMPNSTQLIELWHADKEMLKEKDFRDDPWRLAYNAFMCGFGRGLAVKQQEQLEKSKKDCNNCPHCVDRKDQYGWHFKGCFGGPYKGKFIAEIDECPLEQEQPEVDLAEEIKNYFKEFYMDLTDQGYILKNSDGSVGLMSVKNIARHFYELGLNARNEE